MSKYRFFILFVVVLGNTIYPMFGQVNYFTKVLKPALQYDFPLEDNLYSSCIEGTKKDHWIVYSAESENPTYRDHYGQYPISKLGFLDPCYVIDEKNGFLELVRYNKELLPQKNGIISSILGKNIRYKFKDASKAEYVGWISKSKLLSQNTCWNSSVNMKPLRYWTGISNPELLSDRDSYFKQDTLKLFQESNLLEPLTGGINVLIGNIVYIYKKDEEKKAVLIGTNSTFSPDTTVKMLGWVDEKILTPIGQQKVLTLAKNKKRPMYVMKRFNNNLFELQKDSLKESYSNTPFFFSNQTHSLPFEKSQEVIPILFPSNVWDHSPNRVLNIDGDFINQDDFSHLKSSARNLNILFLFEKNKSLHTNMLRLTNNLQKIWEILQKEEFEGYSVTFNAISYTKSGVSKVDTAHTSFVKLINFIHDEIDQTADNTVTNNTGIGLQSALDSCVKMLEGREQESNVIITIGSNAYSIENKKIEELSSSLSRLSARMLFWKVQHNMTEASENFILFTKALLYEVGNKYSVLKRKYIADFNLYHEANLLKLIDGINNVYLFDSPENSMYQGGLAFPKVNEEFHPVLFEQILDSFLVNVVSDNDLIISSLNSYFTGVGLARSKIDEELYATLKARNQWKNEYRNLPSNTHWDVYWANYFGIRDSLALGFDDYYLISDAELKGIINNIKVLAPKLPIQFSWFFRRRLYRTHKRFGKRLEKAFCYEGDVGKISLQELLFMSNGISSNDLYFYDIKINHIKSHLKLDDAELESILAMLRQKAIQLEEFIIEKPEMLVKYQSQKYYLIPKTLLP